MGWQISEMAFTPPNHEAWCISPSATYVAGTAIHPGKRFYGVVGSPPDGEVVGFIQPLDVMTEAGPYCAHVPQYLWDQ